MRQARWFGHVDALNAPAAMRRWLTAGGSLTARLIAHSRGFRVQRLHQRSALCLADEAPAIGLPRAWHVWEREVLLRCDDAPVVFAHTVVPLSATATDWPLFKTLGERSLGSTLFRDPLVARGALEFARLKPGHPLYQRALAALAAQDGAAPGLLYARRCLYRRRRGSLLVTEVFLPGVLALHQMSPEESPQESTR